MKKPHHMNKFTRQDTLAHLGKNPRMTEWGMYNLLIDEDAINELRWVTDINRIRELCNHIVEQKKGPIEQRPATPEQKALGKAMVAQLKDSRPDSVQTLAVIEARKAYITSEER